MFCNGCGDAIQSGHSFCPKCGKQVVVGVAAPANRVAQHRQLVGVLWIAYSALTAILGVVLMVVFQHIVPLILRYPPPQPHQGPPPEVVFGMIRPLIHFAAVFVLVKGVAGVIAGAGLLQRAHWARILTLVLACLSLLSFPFGTAIGVYSLWVLLAPNAEAEFSA